MKSLDDKLAKLKSLMSEERKLLASIKRLLVGKTITTKWPRGRRKTPTKWVFGAKDPIHISRYRGDISILPKNSRYYVSLSECFVSSNGNDPFEQTTKIDPLKLLLHELKQERSPEW